MVVYYFNVWTIRIKRGFTREIVSFLGNFVVLVLAFFLKNPVSIFFYQTCPFIPFGGYFKGLTTLNILIYEVLAFLLVAFILMIILRLIMLGTKIFEKMLTMTIILGIPSKILGFVIGLLEGVVWVFVIIYIFSLPIFKNNIVADSKWQKNISNFPILSEKTKGFKKASDDIKDLISDYHDNLIDADEFNFKSVEFMLEYKVIDIDSLVILKEKEKLKFKGLDDLIERNGG